MIFSLLNFGLNFSSQNHHTSEFSTLNDEESTIAGNESQLVIALLPWGDLFEDFFDTVGVSVETFQNEFIGSYQFAYINALKHAGIRTILFFVSARISEPLRFIHKPTNTPVCILPASRSYRWYKSLQNNALIAGGVKKDQKFSDVYNSSSVYSSVLTTAKNVVKSFGSYLSIPIFDLAIEMRRERCKVILCQEYDYPRFDIAVLMGKLLSLPVFATFQGGENPQNFLEYPARSLTLKMCDGFIIASKVETQRVRNQYGIPIAKIARVFNPVDLSVWQIEDRKIARDILGIPQTDRIVVYHGRIEIHRKGLDVLLDAWKQLEKHDTDGNLRLLLIGTGGDDEKLRQLIQELGLHRVMWVNEFINDRTVMQRYLSAADLYTLPSRHEGFPIAPLEAMACKLPVVAADAPGIADIFEYGELSGGVVVPCGDAGALASAINRVLDDDALRDQLSQSSYSRVRECFSLETVGPQLRNFLFNDV